MKYTATSANAIASIHEQMVYNVLFVFSYFFHQVQGINLVIKISKINGYNNIHQKLPTQMINKM